jgi:glutathione S-transferase
VREIAGWFDSVLARQPWMAGERFTIADITAFCAIEFARGLMKFKPGEEGFDRTAGLARPRGRAAERARVACKNAPEQFAAGPVDHRAVWLAQKKKRPVGGLGALGRIRVLIRVLGV